MAANTWILTLHLIGLFTWVGALLLLSRMLIFAAKQPADAATPLVGLMRRLYMGSCLPGGVLAIVAGLLMLHGVGSQLGGPGAALKFYFVPKLENGTPSFWYVTFHVKMVSAVLLFLCDMYLLRHLGHLARGSQPKSNWPLATLMGLIASLALLLIVWLPLGALHVSSPRLIGYAVGLPAGIAAFVAGMKIKSARLRYVTLHICIATLMVQALVLIIAKPLSGGVPL
ncbi:MAG: CopD family protein [Planctomycetes bacterium]|nr:CopD family protein [Planctomycetota bacterium]